MLKHLFTFLFLSFWLCGNAQQIVFSGQVSGQADEDLVVEWPADWFGTSWKDTLRVKGGKFQKSIELPSSGWMKLSYKDKDRRVYVWKEGDSLSLVFDADFLDELTIAGGAGKYNTVMQGIQEQFGARLSVAWLNEQALDATNIDAMEMDIFALRNDVLNKLKDLNAEQDDAFLKFTKNQQGYYYYLGLFKFSSVKTGKSSIPKATEIPKVLIEGLDWERMNRASELESEFFRELLLEYVNYKALEEYEFMKFADKNSAVQEAFNIARENLKGESLRYFLAVTMLRNADVAKPSLLRQMHTHLKKQEQSELFVSVVESKIAEQLAAKDEEPVATKVEKHAGPKIKLDLQDLNGKTFGLDDLKGKVIYLDVWASWCGPCRKQFPFAKELKAKFSKKDLKKIAFLYISIDNTESVWKAAIDKLGIEGVHGLSSGGWGSEATNKLGISSIPRYFIFDKQGNVVNQNAPRPSDPNLYDTLKRLIAQ